MGVRSTPPLTQVNYRGMHTAPTSAVSAATLTGITAGPTMRAIKCAVVASASSGVKSVSQTQEIKCLTSPVTDDFSLQTREYNVGRYGAVLRIRRERLRSGLPERTSTVLTRWMARTLDRREPTAVLSDAPAKVDVKEDWATGAVVLVGYSYAIRDVHPDDRDAARWWLHESPPKYQRLIVPAR